MGDVCVVVNAAKVLMTRRQWEEKIYRWHTGQISVHLGLGVKGVM